MAHIEALVRHILKWECGASAAQLAKYADNEQLFNAVRKTTRNPNDPGGWTNSGITLATWIARGYDNDGDGDRDLADLRAMTYPQWITIMRDGYWRRALADRINSQSVANMIVDFMFTSGGAAKCVQRVVGVAADGVFGPKTIDAINARPAEDLFYRLRNARLNYYRSLSAWKHFGKGWTNRVMDLKFVG